MAISSILAVFPLMIETVLQSHGWVLTMVFVSTVLLSLFAFTAAGQLWSTRGLRWVAQTDASLQALFVFTNTRRWVLGYLAVLLLLPLAVVATLGSLPIAIGLLVMMALLPRQLLRTLARRRRALIVQCLPDALSQLAGAMRAGSTFVTAVQIMVAETHGPLAQEFSLFLREHRMGHSIADALSLLGRRVQSEELELVITATLVAQATGGNLARTLQQLAETLRGKIDMEDKVRSLTSQGVLQGRVVAMLPVLVLLALLYLEPVAIRPLFTSALGWGVLLVVTLLQYLGARLIRRIVSIRV